MPADDPAPRRRWTAEDLHYPEHLPVVERRDDLLDAIRDHQVVIVAGETGSGKTTQLPKMCLELGRGADARIAHTQPRRIAARSVAERIADELGVGLGTSVGYQVRFTDHSGSGTQLKVMTDGILLNEMQRDRDLRRYDTIIIDEAHERSLNIDFILGYLKALLPRRPDLKVIVTSATIDPAAFAAHFADPATGEPAPIVEVSGRTYPVEVRYRPLVDPERPDADARDQVTGICEAVEELWTEGGRGGPEDVLVFLSGEREIRDAADALAGMRLPDTDIVPLYARLSAAEQHRVFVRSSNRRVILATNVAETSLTVPGIRYVVDTGTARISRYSLRTKVQRLPIEPVSKASARQRAGRCGRLADGICIRLYAEADYEARPDFTEPEIQRTNLAAVILRMTALGLGDVRRFPFVDAPDPRQVADGYRLLTELRAFRPEDEGHPGRGRRLTAYGRTLARMPVDPRMGRMLVEADRLGATAEALVIVAALSIQDPRERPEEQRTQADQQHARFRDEHSDFITLLNLWSYLREQQKALSGTAFRKMCTREFLHYLRVREWQDLHTQLRQAAKAEGMDPGRRTAPRGGDVDADRIHQALLAGLLSQVGVRDGPRRDYLGARGAHFSIAPGSALFRRQPDFVMSAELVETSRVWARTNARIDPAWAEEAGSHVVKRSYSEPRWSASHGAAVATERVTLYGVTLAADRTVQLARTDAALARELFIRHALVDGDWETTHRFARANADLVRRLGNLEERARRRDLVVDDETLFAFYDKRIPADIVSSRNFDAWWRTASPETPRLLHLTEDIVRRDNGGAVSARDYPTRWRQGGVELHLSYQFAPGTDEDGVTVHIPVEILNRVSAAGFDWLVPGMRTDLAVAHLRALPKEVRRHFVPAPDHAVAALAAIPDDRVGLGPFVAALGDALRSRTGVTVPPDAWDPEHLPSHLRVTFRVEDRRGGALASGPDLEVLRARLAGHVQTRMSTAGAAIERTGLTTWDLDVLPGTFDSRSGRQTVHGYPALVDRVEAVDLRVLPSRAAADAATHRGVRRLLILGTQPPWKRVLANLSNTQKLALAENPHGSVPALLDDCLAAAVDAIVAEHVGDGVVRTRAAYEQVQTAVRTHLPTRVLEVVRAVEPVLAASAEVRRLLEPVERAAATGHPPWLRATVADVRAQWGGLVRPGFVADTGLSRLGDVERYLRGIAARLTKAATNPREPLLQEQVDRVEGAYVDLLGSGADASRPGVRAIAWAIEELRVSLFAQSIGTRGTVSEKRVIAAIGAQR